MKKKLWMVILTLFLGTGITTSCVSLRVPGPHREACPPGHRVPPGHGVPPGHRKPSKPPKKYKSNKPPKPVPPGHLKKAYRNRPACPFAPEHYYSE